MPLYNVTVNSINISKNGQNNTNINTNANTNANANTNSSNDNNNANADTDISNQIKLAGDTIVSGNITFESGNGVVFIRDNTVQLKGKVIGGQIKQQ